MIFKPLIATLEREQENAPPGVNSVYELALEWLTGMRLPTDSNAQVAERVKRALERAQKTGYWTPAEREAFAHVHQLLQPFLAGDSQA